MKRTKRTRKADAIITSDIELRSYQPICRVDNHWAAQERKIRWLRELAEKHDCPIFDGGDLFDKRYKTNPNHKLLGWAMRNLPSHFYTVPGNHDLPGKNYENYSNSAMAVLERAGTIDHLATASCLPSDNEYISIYGFEWGYNFDKIIYAMWEEDTKVALVHAMVYEEFEPFPGCEGYSAKEMMDLLPDFDLIVCGHNHQTFTRREGNRVLVNPGSLMRNDADQIDFKPSVFLWYADENEIERVYVPIEKNVINRDYIDVKKDKENRLDAFVEKLGEQVTHGINYQKNLEAVVDAPSVPKQVKDKVWQYFEGI